MEIWGIEPQTFHMQSERSTTELYPLWEPSGKVCIFERFPCRKALAHPKLVHHARHTRPGKYQDVNFPIFPRHMGTVASEDGHYTRSGLWGAEKARAALRFTRICG